MQPRLIFEFHGLAEQRNLGLMVYMKVELNYCNNLIRTLWKDAGMLSKFVGTMILLKFLWRAVRTDCLAHCHLHKCYTGCYSDSQPSKSQLNYLKVDWNWFGQTMKTKRMSFLIQYKWWTPRAYY